MDHVMYNKMPRMETPLQPSIPCTGKTASSDLQTCKNFLSYPLSVAEEQSSNPWNSATSYLQYAGKALNQHLQSSRGSRCQKPEAEGPFNSMQLSEKSDGQFPVHQHQPAHNYHLSPPRSYPQIAVPRPVYRSPSRFIDPAYGARDFQSGGGHVGSHPLGPSALQWSPSTRFAYSSSFYVPGYKNSYPTLNNYLERTGSSPSHSRGFQELSPVHRQRKDINISVERSSYSQEDVLTDRLHSFAQHNLQVLCAEGGVPIGKQRNSAFTSLKHYKSNSYQYSPDHQVGHMYSRGYYNCAIDGYHQRSPPFSCSMDKSLSPQSIKRTPVYQGKSHKGYMETESRHESHTNSMVETNQFQAQQEMQIRSPTRINGELEKIPEQKEKDMCLESGQVNKVFSMTSSKLDKELLIGSSGASSNLHNRNLHEYCVTELSTNVSFPQQNNPKMLLAVFSNNMVSNGKGKLPNSKNDSYNPDSIRDATTECSVQHNKEMATTEHLKSKMLDQSASPVEQNKISDVEETSRHKVGVQSESSDLPQDNSRGDDCPKSPPMPVINDVFSLAPYRAYLEGKAPHPFPVHLESDVEKKHSTSFLPRQLFSAEEVEDSEKAKLNSENNAKGADTVCFKSPQNYNEETKELQSASLSSNIGVEEVLDLSCKRTSPMKSSTQDQSPVSHKSHETSPKRVFENSLPNASEAVPNKCQKQCSSEVISSPSQLKTKTSTLQTTVNTSCSEKTQSRANGKISLSQEGFPPAEKYIYQSQDNCTFQEPRIQPHLLQRSYSYPTTHNLPHKTSENQSLHTSQNHHLPIHESYTYMANLHSSTVQSQNKCLYQAQEHKPKQIHGSSKDKTTKHLPLQRNEMQPHKHQKRFTPQNTQALQLLPRQNSLSRTTVPGHNYYTCISQPTEAYSFHSSATCSTQSTNISLFVNTIQTPTSLLPQSIIYPPPASVFCPKNLNQPLHPNQPNDAHERRSRNSVDSCQSETSLSGSENEGASFHSSKAFMFHKYKMMKFSSPEAEIQETRSHSSSPSLLRSFSLASDTAQSLPPSAPEPSPTLGEANVSLASVGELSPSGSGKHFSELHKSVCAAITSSVARSPSNMLEDWLEKTKEREKSKIPVKSKNGSRSSEPSPDFRGHEIWLEFEGVRLRLHKLLSQLETFMFTRRCPFPHVIRAGAIFIPIYLVKEVLFPELLGTSVDRILHRHKVELRPTTLSEEKLLRETDLKDCSSRLLKLLALKQLPDMYPDLLHLFCGHTIQDQLGDPGEVLAYLALLSQDSVPVAMASTGAPQHWSGHRHSALLEVPAHSLGCIHPNSRSKKCLGKTPPDSSEEFVIASPTKAKSSLILRLKRVCKSSESSQVYKAQQFRALEKSVTEKSQKRKACRKKSYRDRTLRTSTRRRRRAQSQSRNKGFPDLVGKRILHLFDDGEQETWFPGRVYRVHRPSPNPRDILYEVWYDGEPGTRYFLELQQDYEKGWLKVDC
ncbi:uncharacterized protein C15orf39 homolog [Gastrophryne carolinensis]